jgi:hypothetical protein
VADLPWTVHFVAQTPVLNFVGLSDAVAAPQFAPLLDVAVFDQSCRFFGRSCS